jgi:hypothetical protein
MHGGVLFAEAELMKNPEFLVPGEDGVSSGVSNTLSSSM